MSETVFSVALLGRRMLALQGVTFHPGTNAKRFVRETCCREPERLTDRQRQYVEALCWTFRKQLPADLVPEARPEMVPRSAPTPPKPPSRKAQPRPKRPPALRDLLTR